MDHDIRLKRLKELRKQKGFTQEQMAKRLGYKGKSGYCQLENGQAPMTIDRVELIAEVLGKEVFDIFFSNNVHATRTKSTV